MSGQVNGVLTSETPASGATNQFQYLQADNGTNVIGHYVVNGSPEGLITANTGSQAVDADNGALWVKQTDGVNTGWERLQNNASGWITVPGGAVYNLGFAYSAGTFTLQGADASLSSVNPGYAILPDKTNPTQSRLYTLNANQDFIDDAGASQIIGNLFGLTTGTAFASDRPFFVYLVANDDNVTLKAMLSASPCNSLSPAAAKIGDPSSAIAALQDDFWSFDDITEAEYDENPCIPIGAIRMQMSASDDWTVQTLNSQDGVGNFQENTQFTYVRGHGGAPAGTHAITNGDTLPTCAANSIRYNLYRNGLCKAWMNLKVNNAPTGTNNLFFAMPYVENQSSGGIRKHFQGLWLDAFVRKVSTFVVKLDTQSVGELVATGTSTVVGGGSLAINDEIDLVYDFNAFNSTST